MRYSYTERLPFPVYKKMAIGHDRKHFLWYAALFTCLTLVIVLFSLITVLTAPASVTLDIDCADGENEELSCNNGEDDNAFVIPNVSLSLDIGPAFAENNNYFPGIEYRGVSLAGGECEGELASKGVYTPVDNDAELFIRKGMNLFRIPIRWEHIAYLNGTFYADNTLYLAKLDALIENLSNKGAAIVLDLHNDMLYNDQRIVTNPSGPDGYAGTGIARLWYNLVRRYSGPDMIYSVMYAPTWGRTIMLYQAVYAAVTGIRRGELSNTQTGRYVHRLILPVIDILDVSNNHLVLSYRQIPLIGDRYAIEALPYFDQFSRGEYPGDVCREASEYIPIFDVQWPLFMAWAVENKQTIFISEFGIPVNPNCERILTYFLDKIHTFFYNRTQDAGIFGWSAWAGGLPGCGVKNPAISLAPGYDANVLMWNDTFFYSKYLSPLVRTIPPLLPGRLAIRVLNKLPSTLRLLSGYVPFQFQGSASALPGQYVLLYSSNNYSTPNHGLQTRYSIGGPDDIFIGFNPPDQLGLSIIYTNPERNCANFVKDINCNITETRNITVSSGPRCYFLNPLIRRPDCL